MRLYLPDRTSDEIVRRTRETIARSRELIARSRAIIDAQRYGIRQWEARRRADLRARTTP